MGDKGILELVRPKNTVDEDCNEGGNPSFIGNKDVY